MLVADKGTISWKSSLPRLAKIRPFEIRSPNGQTYLATDIPGQSPQPHRKATLEDAGQWWFDTC